jgi:hypothetical protein
MRNPNSPAGRLKKGLAARWSGEDYPGAEPRFQLPLLARDVAVFLVLPGMAVAAVKALEEAETKPRRPKQSTSALDRTKLDSSGSQIIHFALPAGPSHGGGGGTGGHGAPRRSPGSLIRVRLLNVVETYSTAPVHAQIADASLGAALMGGTLIGDATPDSNFDRISIQFRFARDPNRDGVAVPLTARALSLDGTLGLEAGKKEGFIARSAIGSAAVGAQDLQKGGNPTDLRDVLLRALTAGLVQELGSSTQVERNRAQVLSLSPQTEFFAELTDFFPGGGGN